jgi:L-2-hydroxycarboxylate dehydrogenase (NAD+)
MKVRIEALEEVIQRGLRYFRYSDEESAVITEVLLYAQLRGNNQGVVKLTGEGLPRDPLAGDIRAVKETTLSTLLDGARNPGMVVMRHATDIAIQKAKEHGFGIVGINNTASSTGAIGYYADRIAREDLLGFVFAGSYPRVAMHGSYEPIFGTNPLAVGLPTENDPVVLDITTAASAWYGVIEAHLAGRDLAPEVAYDVNGQPTTNPAQAMSGALRTFGAHKGAALSLMVEALTGPLVMASYAGLGEGLWGNLIYAINPELLVEKATFKAQMSEMVAKIKSMKPLEGVETIFVPGERGNTATQAARTSGEIEIEDNLWEALQKVGV